MEKGRRRKTEEGRPKTEDGRPKTEDGTEEFLSLISGFHGYNLISKRRM
jgi:hypothetical protein